MQEWRLLNLPSAADHSNNFIRSTLCSHFGKRGKMGALGGFQQLPGAPGGIRPGWPCRHPGVTQRALIQQLLMAQCHSSWELAWEAGAAGWRLLEKFSLADGITLCLCLGFPEEVFFQFFIDSSSLLLSISQSTGGYFFIFSCFFSIYLFIINMDQTPRVCQRGPALRKQPCPDCSKYKYISTSTCFCLRKHSAS